MEHSTLYSPTGQIINATEYGPECPQYGAGAEFCLYLNIQTPYFQNKAQRRLASGTLLDPWWWIYFRSAADPGTDGGNLASREDIVVVQIQYRLSTLGS